jgi:hypothetical protein
MADDKDDKKDSGTNPATEDVVTRGNEDSPTKATLAADSAPEQELPPDDASGGMTAAFVPYAEGEPPAPGSAPIPPDPTSGSGSAAPGSGTSEKDEK